MSKLSYGHQYIDQNDIKAVIKVLKTDWLTCGPKVLKFEKKLASFCNARYAVAVSSGTAALHTAYWASSIQKGGEVITTPLTFSATSMAFCYLGAKPVFCDVDENLNLDPKEIEKKITKKTKAIAVVDFAGHPAQLDEIKTIAKKEAQIKELKKQKETIAMGEKNKTSKLKKDIDNKIFGLTTQKLELLNK